MSTRKAVNAALALLALLGITLISGSARADGAITGHQFISGQFYDHCTGELVIYSGDVHYVAKLTTNSDGSTTVYVRENYADVHGVGDESGRKYEFAANDDLEFTSGDGGEFYSEWSRLRVLSQGSVDNEFVWVRTGYIHDFTNGIYLDFYELSDTCRG